MTFFYHQNLWVHSSEVTIESFHITIIWTANNGWRSFFWFLQRWVFHACERWQQPCKVLHSLANLILKQHKAFLWFLASGCCMNPSIQSIVLHYVSLLHCNPYYFNGGKIQRILVTEFVRAFKGKFSYTTWYVHIHI